MIIGLPRQPSSSNDDLRVFFWKPRDAAETQNELVREQTKRKLVRQDNKRLKSLANQSYKARLELDLKNDVLVNVQRFWLLFGFAMVCFQLDDNFSFCLLIPNR